MEPVTHLEAQRLVKYCYCSSCWEHLTMFTAHDEAGEIVKGDNGISLVEVRCNTEGCPRHGYVSKKTVERRLSESHAERQEARIALRAAVPWLRPEHKSTNKLLEELGY